MIDNAGAEFVEEKLVDKEELENLEKYNMKPDLWF